MSEKRGLPVFPGPTISGMVAAEVYKQRADRAEALLRRCRDALGCCHGAVVDELLAELEKVVGDG